MARRRFIWYIFPAFLLVTFSSLLAVSYYVTRAFEDLHTSQTAADLEARAALLRAIASTPRLRGDLALLREQCAELGAKANMRITVIGPDGTVLVDTDGSPARMDNHADRPEVRAAMTGETGRAVRFSDTLNTRMMYVALPGNVETDPRVYRVALPLTAATDALHPAYWRLALVVLGVCIVAAIGSWLVSRRIMRPLAALKAGAERFARGELEPPLPVPASEEIARLAEAMNVMAAQLADRIRAAEQQRNEMEAVFSSMIESVLAVDTEFRIISINEAAVTLLDIGREPAKGRPLQEVVPNPVLHDFARSALAGEGLVETELALGSSAPRSIKAQGTVLRDGTGRAMGAVIVLHDITRLRRLEAMRQDFVANVSHELKTPITSIKGFVETLLDEPAPGLEDTRHFLQIIEKQANRLDAIIVDLLSLSRLEQGSSTGDFATAPAPVGAIIEAAAELCRYQADRRKIHLRIDCPPDLVAPVNPPLLEQGLVNLVNNAIKYSEAGQTVHVCARMEAPALLIEVRDAGAGIHAHELERIFERFYRIDKARSRELGGTGLGLSIVKHIAQVHRGTVSVDSAPGQGSTFTLRLPAV